MFLLSLLSCLFQIWRATRSHGKYIATRRAKTRASGHQLLIHMADEPATPVAEELKIRVKSASVEVFITLNAKFLAQPLDKALINPFIKVYNKKTDVPVTLESLISIHVTGAACPDGPMTIDTAKDPTVAASTILGSKEGVHIEFTFAEQMMPVFTEGMSEVEKLKARRRAENAAKRAAAGATDDAAAASDPSADTPPVPPPPLPAAPVERLLRPSSRLAPRSSLRPPAWPAWTPSRPALRLRPAASES